ncbi:hypothetical protein ACR79K_27225 [Sphingobacterium siyangense]|uniref:hypothetical protein n=1 Tax=Sphingobacterium siyangense TaxID=459529 RepID=UPI003DA22DAB
MKTKQEVIQEAYDNTFPDSSNYSFDKIRSAVDENGWYRFIEGLTVNICTTGFDHDKGAYRPQSIRGIENNRGWTIADVTKLPTEGIYNVGYFLDDGTFHLGNDEVEWYELREYVVCFGFTHYQPIIKPEAPIY